MASCQLVRRFSGVPYVYVWVSPSGSMVLDGLPCGVIPDRRWREAHHAGACQMVLVVVIHRARRMDRVLLLGDAAEIIEIVDGAVVQGIGHPKGGRVVHVVQLAGASIPLLLDQAAAAVVSEEEMRVPLGW